MADLIMTSLISVHDHELKLLENMKNCMMLRLKADKEYANNLLTIATQATKQVSLKICSTINN